VLDVHFIKVGRIGRGAFVELKSEEDVKLALIRSGHCVNATCSNLYGRILGMCLNSLSVS